jgi:hypothetical protein
MFFSEKIKCNDTWNMQYLLGNGVRLSNIQRTFIVVS